jgi:hypothetical protein
MAAIPEPASTDPARSTESERPPHIVQATPARIERWALRQRYHSWQSRRDLPSMPAAAREFDVSVGRRDQPVGDPTAPRALDQFLGLTAIAQGLGPDVGVISHSQNHVDSHWLDTVASFVGSVADVVRTRLERLNSRTRTERRPPPRHESFGHGKQYSALVAGDSVERVRCPTLGGRLPSADVVPSWALSAYRNEKAEHPPSSMPRTSTMAVSETHDREEAAIGQVRARLQARFSERSRTDVTSIVNHAAARFADARIRDFIPLLVERISRDELDHRVTV